MGQMGCYVDLSRDCACLLKVLTLGSSAANGHFYCRETDE